MRGRALLLVLVLLAPLAAGTVQGSALSTLSRTLGRANPSTTTST